MLPIGALAAGAFLGYLIGQDGRPSPAMVVCPPQADGRVPSFEELGLSPLGLAAGVERRESGVLVPINEVLHHDMQPYVNSGVFYLERLLDAQLARLVTFVLSSTCNQALTVQGVSHVSDSPNDANGLMNVGTTRNLPATNGRIAIQFWLEKTWLPYLGVTVTAGATAPTTGRVVIQAFGQRWVKSVQALSEA